ncbi:DUF6049 family protein [Streptomyces sp. T-3]|nr:DUF6049 family protein [Streptomyces sp. T-3]
MAEAADFQGMTPSPARRWLRRTTGLLAAAPLLAGLMQLPAAPAAQAVNADATGSRSVDVSVNRLTPNVPTEDDTLTISGKVTNDTKQTVTGARVALRVGPVMTGRTDIDNASKRIGADQGLEGTPIGDKYVEKFDKLVPGVPQDFTLSVPVKELELSSEGVYQLGVTLTGRTAGQPTYDQTLGVQRTFLPWQPEAAEEKTKLTYMWPLISRVHMTAETAPDEQQTPVFADDSLAKEIAPGGRLDAMLSLGKDLPVTWVIDPDLLAALDAMQDPEGYKVKNAAGAITTGSEENGKLARQWLKQLEEAVQGKKVVALPYADPDLASLAHKDKESLGYLKDATDAARTTVNTVLHVTPSTDFAWPVNGAIDPSIVGVATSAGAHTVIARSDSLRETGNLQYTPSAARPIGGGNTTVVADARLSTAFQGDMTKAEDSALAVQEFLAQSQMITLQDPEKQRSIVVAPQRMPSTSQAQAMAQALGAPGADRWSQSDDLLAAAKAKPDPKATTQVPGTGAYPDALRAQELPEKVFTDIKTTKERLDSFKVILSEPDRVVPPFGRAIDRGMSSSWRGHRDEATQYNEDVRDWLKELTSQVKLIPKTEVKLSGRSATIPVTIQNNLVQGVELTLRLTSGKPNRLKVGDGPYPYKEQQVKIAAAHSQSIKFTTTANANGPVPVTAQLYTADGAKYGKPITFDVNVTEVTPTVMLVIAGGVLLLVLAGFRMYTQRKAAARRVAEEAGPGDEDGPEGESGGGSGEDDPEQPSDPTPDTAPESTDPSSTGERVDR